MSRQKLVVSFGALAISFFASVVVQAQVLSFVNIYSNGFDGITGIGGPRIVRVSPDGDNVYATGETSNSIAVFARDEVTGELTQIQTLVDGVGGNDGLMGAQNIEISADGKFVYVGATFEAAISVFSRDRNTGLLSQVQVVREGIDAADGLTSTIWLRLSNDGKNLYSAAVGDSAVAVWSRNKSTGMLTFRQLLKNGVGGVTGIGGAFGIDVSKNGKQVYVTGLMSNSVTVFSRDKKNGDLSQVQVVTDGVGGVDGLLSARNVILSRNGKQAYVTGIGDNAVSVFQVDKKTGALTQTQVLKDNSVGGAADGLLQATGVIESRDGRYVFTAAFGELRIGIFDRNTQNGSLTFNSTIVNGIGNPGGLRGVIDFAIAKGDDNCGQLYSAGFRSNSIDVWSLLDCSDDDDDDDDDEDDD